MKEDVKDYKEAEVEEDHKEEGGRWTTRSPCCPVHGLQGDHPSVQLLLLLFSLWSLICWLPKVVSF